MRGVSRSVRVSHFLSISNLVVNCEVYSWREQIKMLSGMHFSVVWECTSTNENNYDIEAVVLTSGEINKNDASHNCFCRHVASTNRIVEKVYKKRHISVIVLANQMNP